MPRTPSKLTRLGRLRIIAGCDGKALASDAGISYQLLKMIERGQGKGKRRMTEETARKISTATGVSAHWLMGKGLKTKPTTDRSVLEKFSGEAFTKEYFTSTRERIESQSSLKTTSDVDSFCRIEASGHAKLLQFKLEFALRGAVRIGAQNRVLGLVDDCLRAIDRLDENLRPRYMTREEIDINAAFQAAIARRRSERKPTPARSAKTLRPALASQAPGNS